MSTQPPQGGYGPQDPYGQQQAYGQGYPQGYNPQAYSGQYGAQPRGPLDLGKIVSIGAWVVLALTALVYLYTLTQDDFSPDFEDRFFGGMTELAQGIFWSGLLHGVAVWLDRNKG